MSNPRQTQFSGFARALLNELLEGSIVSIERPLQDDWREDLERIIAQRAYDLALHASINTAKRARHDITFCYDDNEYIEKIPDLTEMLEMIDYEQETPFPTANRHELKADQGLTPDATHPCSLG